MSENLHGNILIVDDDTECCRLMELVFESNNYSVSSCSESTKFFSYMSDTIDLIFLDIAMPEKSGLEILPELRTLYPSTPVVISSAADFGKGLEAFEKGASWFLQKPFSAEKVLEITKELLSRVVPKGTLTPDDGQPIGREALLRKAASTHCTLFIAGESGVGKSYFAQKIHSWSKRASKPFVSISCSSLPANLLEAELFGYEKGAFTGASKSKPGLVETADGGTLFLDEIGDLPLELQPKLLTFLENKTFTRLGSTQQRNVDVRIMTATWKNLEEMCAQSTFREDLFYRLMVFPITINPLRERMYEVPLLVQSILSTLSSTHEKNFSLSENARDKICSYRWPGNIRELVNTLERAAILSDGEVIHDSHIVIINVDENETESEAARLSTLRVAIEEELNLVTIEINTIKKALENTDWNRSAAAQLLGLSPRGLYNKIKRYKLDETV